MRAQDLRAKTWEPWEPFCRALKFVQPLNYLSLVFYTFVIIQANIGFYAKDWKIEKIDL